MRLCRCLRCLSPSSSIRLARRRLWCFRITRPQLRRRAAPRRRRTRRPAHCRRCVPSRLSIAIPLSSPLSHPRPPPLPTDVKCENIFLTDGGLAKLGDLGVAKLLTSHSNFAQTLVGTPFYLSPELCENRPYNERSDVWALGCVLYEMLTLRHPFDATSQAALFVKIVRGNCASLCC